MEHHKPERATFLNDSDNSAQTSVILCTKTWHLMFTHYQYCLLQNLLETENQKFLTPELSKLCRNYLGSGFYCTKQLC